MTKRISETQFERLNDIGLMVAQISDALGSESTNPGLLLTTHAQDIETAASELLPKTFRVILIETSRLAPEYTSDGPERELLVKLIGIDVVGASAALCGGESFTPDEGDRGSFYVLLFLHTEQAVNSNILVSFPRAET